jgi:hypothetical protein
MVEAGAIMTLLIQDADKIDDRVAALKVLMQLRRIVDVRFDQTYRRQHQQRPMSLSMARQYPDRMTLGCQPVYKMRSDKAGAAEHADSARVHVQFTVTGPATAVYLELGLDGVDLWTYAAPRAWRLRPRGLLPLFVRALSEGLLSRRAGRMGSASKL